MTPHGGEITARLREWSRGEPGALERLLPYVISDLSRAAAYYLEHEDIDHTLEPTALVNEVYLRLRGRRKVCWTNRAQFFSFAGKLIRFILIDCARERKALLRGGGMQMESLTGALGVPERPHLDPETLLDLDRALEVLEKDDPRAARIVELRFFSGMTETETAQALGIAVATVKRDWENARHRLALELGGNARPIC